MCILKKSGICNLSYLGDKDRRIAVGGRQEQKLEKSYLRNKSDRVDHAVIPMLGRKR
jgi:hypothetical protein